VEKQVTPEQKMDLMQAYLKDALSVIKKDEIT